MTSVTTGNTTVSYTYDAYGRMTRKVTAEGGTTILTETFTYRNPTGTTTSAQIQTHTISRGYSEVLMSTTYSYDDNGNIIGISNESASSAYTYDSANQLIRENNSQAGKSWTWAYDNAGNITSRKEYTYNTGTLGAATSTANYAYGDSAWGDLLTGYNGSTVTSDAIGNMLSDGTRTFTWEHGRELATVTKNGVTWTNTYDANGMRTARTSSNTVYQYVYSGSSLLQMRRGSDTFLFQYEASGIPVALTYNNTRYYYVTNIQGDVVAILDSSGTAVVTYTYDAWGKILSTTGSMASTLGAYNHFIKSGQARLSVFCILCMKTC